MTYSVLKVPLNPNQPTNRNVSCWCILLPFRHLEFLANIFFDFSRWRPPPSWNCRNVQEVHTALSCRISWRSVKLSRRYDFPFLQYGGFPPSWICDALVWTTHEGNLVVFTTVQNLVGIDAVVSTTCMFLIWRVWLGNADSSFGGTATKPVHRL